MEQWLYWLGIGFSLAMDAFCVSISTGIALRGFKPLYAIKTGVFFGGFQFLMPLLGYLAAGTIADYVEAVNHWIAFTLLAFIGTKLIWDGLHGTEEAALDPSKTGRLALLALATSVDAFAVGVSLAVVSGSILPVAASAGILTLLLSFAGVLIGERLGTRFQGGALLVGGVVLCLIAMNTLIEHLL